MLGGPPGAVGSRLLADRNSTLPRKTCDRGARLFDLDAELGAQVGHDGGGSADGEEGRGMRDGESGS